MKMPKRTASRLRSGRLKVEWSAKGTKMMEAMSYITISRTGFSPTAQCQFQAHFFFIFKELLYICNENNKILKDTR